MAPPAPKPERASLAKERESTLAPEHEPLSLANERETLSLVDEREPLLTGA